MAKDKIHEAVRLALINDGWHITKDPFVLTTGGVDLEIDMAAEKFILAEREAEKILVEVKSLDGRSLVYDFHATIGQYIDYRDAIQDEQIERILWLALSETAFRRLQKQPFLNDN